MIKILTGLATLAVAVNAGSLRSETGGYVKHHSGCQGDYCAFSCPGSSKAWTRKNGEQSPNQDGIRTDLYQGKPHNYPKHGKQSGIANVQCCEKDGKRAYRSNRQRWWKKKAPASIKYGRKFNCESGKTRDEANKICKRANMRLCTAKEACFDNVGAGTGCNFNHHNVWWVVASSQWLFSLIFLYFFLDLFFNLIPPPVH